MSVTVVVISRNRRADLLSSLAHHRTGVILVDNASTDGTVPAVRSAFPEVTVIPLPHNIGAVARNVGVRAARTPYVAFADDDSWWAPDALSRAAEVFARHPRVGLVTGRILVGPAQRLDPLSAAMATAPLGVPRGGAGPDVLGFAACAAAVRRSAFLAVGGFDEVVRFPGEEERVAYDLADAGWLLSYVDELVVHHHPSPVRGPASERRVGIARSALLTAAMRRPWREAAELAASGLRAGGEARAGVLAAVPRLPAALRRRRQMSDRLADRLHRLALAEQRAGRPAGQLTPVA
jgi:GT2 family glycosyltransferase